MKKLILLALMIIPTLSFGQITLEDNRIDEFTGSVNQRTKSSSLVFRAENANYPTLSIGMGRVDSLYYFVVIISTNSMGCLSKYDGKCLVKFNDGSVSEFGQISETQCNDYLIGQYVFVPKAEFNNPIFKAFADENIAKLRITPVERIRIYGSKGYIDFVPNPKFKPFDPTQVFIKHLEII